MSVWIKFIVWLIISYGYANLIGGKIPYFIFYTSLVLFLLAALGRRGVRKLSVETKLSSDRSQVGGTVTLDITLTNGFSLPLPWVMCKVFLPEEFGEAGRRVVLSYLKGKTSQTVSLEVPCHRRGFFGGGLLEVQAGDIFGFMVFRRKLEFPFELIVYPHLIDVQRLLLGSGNVFGRQTFFRLGRQTSVLAGVRKYVPGDQLTKVHWKASAKKRELLVKEFEKQMIDKLHIFIDGNASHHFGEGRDGTAEWAITVGGSLAQDSLQKGFEVGLYLSGEERIGLPPGKGRVHLLHILEVLAKANISDNVPFHELIAHEALGRDKGTMIVVTPFLDEMLVETLHGLKAHGQNPFLIFLDPTTFDPKANIEKGAEFISRINSDRIPLFIVEKAHLEGETGEGDYAANI